MNTRSDSRTPEPEPALQPVPAGIESSWQTMDVPEALSVRSATLRCWWAHPAGPPSLWRGGVLVLPEVFGVNAWIRLVTDRLAGWGYGALAVPLFARSAPSLDLGYEEAGLREGRGHKGRTCSEELLADVDVAATWLQGCLLSARETGGPQRPPSRAPDLGCVGFCFGGHVAILAAGHQAIAATASFYGAGVAGGRPGGGPPTLEILPQIRGRLVCFCGEQDPLIPLADVEALAAALTAADPSGQRLCLRRVGGAGHGFMCEARADHRPAAAERGWQELEALFREGLTRSA